MLKKLYTENSIVGLLLSVHFVFFLFLALFSEATYDAGDGIKHYLIARYSWSHPYLLLDSWGKPFFTLISSPFAQFGLIGAVFFNILCGTGASYFAYKICKKMEIDNAWIAIPFVMFAVGFFPSLISGLTEPFFSFVLMSGIYAFLVQKYTISSIIISFLPLIRTEGNFILPLFFIALLYRKQLKQIVLLGTGSLLYSFVGLYYLNDFLWIKNQNPYNGANRDFYGSGELLHFVFKQNDIWGTTLTVLFLVGIFAFLFQAIKSKSINVKVRNSFLLEKIVLLFGSFAVYFIAHTLMWWKGWANSLGLIRVMAAVIPCTSIIAVVGLNTLLKGPFLKTRFNKFIIIFVILFSVYISPFKNQYFPFNFSPEQKVIRKAGNWIKSSIYKKQKIYYLYPYLTEVLNIDIYDSNKAADLWGLYPNIKSNGISSIPDSTLVLWDAHFGPNECRIPLSEILVDKNFKLIKVFSPDVAFKTIGGYQFDVYLFMKTQNFTILKETKNYTMDFENDNHLFSSFFIDSTIASTGIKSCKIINTNEYAALFSLPAIGIPKNSIQLKIKAEILNLNDQVLNFTSVYSVNNQLNNNILWEAKEVAVFGKNKKKGWQSIEIIFNLNPQLFATKLNTLKCYFWNKNKQMFYIDNLKYSFIVSDIQ